MQDNTPGIPPELSVDDLIRTAIQESATDIHIIVGGPPVFRIANGLVSVRLPNLTPADSKRLSYEKLSHEEVANFESGCQEHTKSFAGHGRRFRLTVNKQKGHICCNIRILPTRVRTADELGLPKEVADLARKKRGLVLITGKGGMGKTTTLAAMVDVINRERQAHVVIIDDPMEYIHTPIKSIISQREVGGDTQSYASGLKTAMKQNADVIVLGELIDAESLETAIWAAETGHFIIATMHTYDIGESIDRIVNAFPPHQQTRILAGLATALQGVISQQLVPRLNTDPELGMRVAAIEVIPTTTIAIQRLIREGRLYVRDPYIRAASAEGLPVLTMEEHLTYLYQQGKIDENTLVLYSQDMDTI
jgi:twitching motility protein PilT